MMERRIAPKNIKKEICECYNCGIKKYLVRDYRKPKTEPKLQRR